MIDIFMVFERMFCIGSFDFDSCPIFAISLRVKKDNLLAITNTFKMGRIYLPPIFLWMVMYDTCWVAFKDYNGILKRADELILQIIFIHNFF